MRRAPKEIPARKEEKENLPILPYLRTEKKKSRGSKESDKSILALLSWTKIPDRIGVLERWREKPEAGKVCPLLPIWKSEKDKNGHLKWLEGKEPEFIVPDFLWLLLSVKCFQGRRVEKLS